MPKPRNVHRTRASSDEHYVIDLCDYVIGQKASRQHRFDFLVGDPGKDGRCRRLPVDAYYEKLALVVEFMERQHSTVTPFFDKPSRMTVSGVHRGEQRQLYDQRRREVLPAHGMTLVSIESSAFRTRGDKGRKLVRDHEQDAEVIRKKLAAFLTV